MCLQTIRRMSFGMKNWCAGFSENYAYLEEDPTVEVLYENTDLEWGLERYQFSHVGGDNE